jgi:diguanylate cyclase (GGDEF)-like protein
MAAQTRLVTGSSLRRLLRRRPAETWGLLCLLLGGTAGCLVAALLPMSPTAPIGLLLALTVVGLLLSAVVMTRARLSSYEVLGVLLLSIVLTDVLVTRSTTTGGAILPALMYLWKAIFAAYFLPRRVARSVVAFEAVSYGVALHATGLPGMLTPWVTTLLSCVVATEVHGRLVERLQERADTDPLTGLLNRAGLLRAAARELARSARSGQPLALAVIDLDGFKKVNDTSGHAAGDRLLADVAAAWSESLRATDVLARQGGDEFVLLLPGADFDEAATVLDRLREECDVEWSCGVAVRKPGDDLDQMLARADVRLYEAKAARQSPPTHGRQAPSTDGRSQGMRATTGRRATGGRQAATGGEPATGDAARRPAATSASMAVL